MAEEVSPESKLYVKEEIEKSRKEFKEDLAKARSWATRTFATIAMIIGLLGSLGIYGLVKSALSDTTIKKIESSAAETHSKIVEQGKEANKILTEIKNDANDIRSFKVVVGTIVSFGGSVEKNKKELEKKGWLFCDGAKVERSRYMELYKIIGTAFGKPDERTFNLPDLRGRFVRGVDVEDQNKDNWRDPDHKTRSESASGGNRGNKIGSYQLDNIQTHIHQWGEYKKQHLYSWNEKLEYVRALKDQGHNQIPSGKGKNDDYMDVENHRFWTNPHDLVGIPGTETRPKNVYVNWIIKAK